MRFALCVIIALTLGALVLPQVSTATDDPIVGRWSRESIYVYNFYEDGTLTYDQNGVIYEGTWEAFSDPWMSWYNIVFSGPSYPTYPYPCSSVSYSIAPDGLGLGDVACGDQHIFVWAPLPGPVAAFEASPLSGSVPLIVTFTDTSTGEGITSREWQYKLNSDSTWTPFVLDATSSFTFSNAGNYDIRLTVIDSEGTDYENKRGYINVVVPPVAAFEASPLSGSVPLTVTFTDTSTGNIWVRYWDFNNDGIFESTPYTHTPPPGGHPSFVYTEPGYYTVKLRVDGPDGPDEKIEEGLIHVKARPLDPSFSWAPLDGPAPLTVKFSDATIGDPTTWDWDFGDSCSSTDQNPTHTFTQPGEYQVRLGVYNGLGDPASTENTVSVTPGLGVVKGFVRMIRGYDVNTGVIVDNIEGADIRLDPDAALQPTLLAKTDSNGCFSIDAPVGEYTIYISFYDRDSNPLGPVQYDEQIFVEGGETTKVIYPPNFLNARLEKDKANEAITKWNAVIKTQRWQIAKVEGVATLIGLFLVPFKVHEAVTAGVEATGEYLIKNTIKTYWDETGGGDLKEAAIHKLIKYCFSIEDDMIAQFERQRDDPPDPNFQQVYQLQLPDEANASVNSTDPYLTTNARLTYLGEIQNELDTALLTSYERYLGASQANDTAAMRMQLTAVVSFADAMHLNTVNYTKTIFDLRSIVQTNQSYDEFMLTSIQTRLQQEGFTADEIAALREQGLSDEGMETYKQALIAFNYSTYLSNLEGYAEISRNRAAAAQSLADQASGVLHLMDNPSLLSPVSFPGLSSRPSDPNEDGLYEDCNGNGRADFADVVLYFNEMSWTGLMEPVSAFDYNGNGRIDFADVVWLFNHL